MSIFPKACAWSAAAAVCLLMVQASAHAAPRKLLRHAEDAGKFTFIVYGDTRSHLEVHRAVVADIVAMRPEFVLQSGDLVSDGSSARQWDEFTAVTKPLRDAGIAYYPARGNHDLGSRYIGFAPRSYDSGNGYYYAFTRHHNRFLIVDNFEDYSPGSTQYRWLESELAKAQKSAVNTFVMFHEAPYSVGPHGPTPEPQQFLHPLFVKYHPRAVFCGHDHLYYRTVRDGVRYFVTGGGGAPLYTADNRAYAIPGDIYATAHHVIRIDVDGRHVTATVMAHLFERPAGESPDPAFALSYAPFEVTEVTAGGSRVLMTVNQPGLRTIDRVSFGP